MRKLLLIAVGLILLGFIGKCLYQIACISCTIPPVAEYECNGSTAFFKHGLDQVISTNKEVAYYKLVDTVGDRDSGFAYDVDIKFNDGKFYNLRYESSSDNHVKIELIGAHDLSNNTGGYGANAVGMDKIMAQFNELVLKPLKDSQHIELKPIEK